MIQREPLKGRGKMSEGSGRVEYPPAALTHFPEYLNDECRMAERLKPFLIAAAAHLIARESWYN
jgi:hypothetical protein